jgi:hypothetical protein
VGDLADVIFCKVQAIYTSVTSLIKKSYTARHLRHESALDVFTNLGVFSLEEIGENAPESMISQELLVQLLVHLHIIAPAPSTLSALLSSSTSLKNPYLMPCMLRCSRERVQIPEGNPEPLKLRFKCGFTPVGVFPAMIAKLVNEPGWTILPEQDRIFKNRVRFRVEPTRDIIFMVSHLRYFEIAVLTDLPKSAAKVCYGVREVIEDTLEEVTVNMNYDFLGGHEYAFWCSNEGCANHLAVVKEATSPSAFMECCQNKADIGNLNPHQKVWFSKVKSKSMHMSIVLRELRCVDAC